jgi:hypothetical protein
MDWKGTALVYGILFATGVVISLLSTQLQCSKVSFSTALQQGAIFGAIPTILYGLASYFEAVRKPFIDSFLGFGVDGPTSAILGMGYLLMLGAWPAGVWNVHNSEAATCISSAAEMTEFKDKLMKELAEKQAAEEANATAKPSQ